MEEDNIGDPVRYFLYPNSSGNIINHVNHLLKLKNYLQINLKKIKYIFEFGGGYGCMARIFYKINKNIKYSIFDTKLVNLIQYYYLKQNKMDVGFKNKNQFTLENETLKLNNKKQKQSLFLANWSLSEAPINYRNKFLKLIDKYDYIFIAFQEYFEEVNNRQYFNNFEKKLKKNYKIY